MDSKKEYDYKNNYISQGVGWFHGRQPQREKIPAPKTQKQLAPSPRPWVIERGMRQPLGLFCRYVDCNGEVFFHFCICLNKI